MTVNTTSNRITYLANGSTTEWVIPFPPIDAEFIQVFVIDSLGAVEGVPLNSFSVTLNPTVDPNPTAQSGSVTYPLIGPPLAVGNSISIVRTLPAEQRVSLSNQSIIYPAVVEQEFDYLTLLAQGGIEEFTRAFRVGPTDPIPSIVPPVGQRANKQAFFDLAGNLTAGTIPAGGVFISAPMIPVVEGATLQISRDAMGVPPINNPVFTGDPQAPTPVPGDNDTSIATTAYVQSAIAAFINSVFTTGDLKPTHKTVADAGWIMWVNGTIGDGSSGGSIRANADTQNLFNIYYNNYSDVACPLFTSTGVSTTRALQGTAATAYGAHVRMSLPQGPGRSLAISGQGAGLANRPLGSADGEETHTQTIAELRSHSHPVFALPPELGGPGGGIFGNGIVDSMPVGTNTALGGLVPVIAYFSGGSQAFNVLDPRTYINVMVKL